MNQWIYSVISYYSTPPSQAGLLPFSLWAKVSIAVTVVLILIAEIFVWGHVKRVSSPVIAHVVCESGILLEPQPPSQMDRLKIKLAIMSTTEILAKRLNVDPLKFLSFTFLVHYGPMRAPSKLSNFGWVICWADFGKHLYWISESKEQNGYDWIAGPFDGKGVLITGEDEKPNPSH
jgi:hypothetical protein